MMLSSLLTDFHMRRINITFNLNASQKTCSIVGPSLACAHTCVGPKDSFGEDLNQARVSGLARKGHCAYHVVSLWTDFAKSCHQVLILMRKSEGLRDFRSERLFAQTQCSTLEPGKRQPTAHLLL